MERNAHEGESRADVDDIAPVAWSHTGEGGHRAPDLAEEGDLHRPLELSRLDVLQGGECSGHGVVDPGIDGTQLGFDPGGGGVDLLVAGHVGWDHERPLSERGNLLRGRFEPGGATSQQGHVETPFGERSGRRPADAGRCTGDHGNTLSTHLLLPCRSHLLPLSIALCMLFTMHVFLNP